MRKLAGLLGILIGGCSILVGQDSGPVIKAEKKLVLVDVVVTDKKGEYVHGLTQKDFRVWEDKDEQTIESFSAESDADPSVPGRNHYIVLFFDATSIGFAEQMQARQAALKFLDKNAGPNRLIAIVNYGGALQVAQNFTSNVDRLKQVVSGVKSSAVASNTDVAGGAALTRAETSFGARTVLLGLRDLAKNLATVPGRKTLVFLSGGFSLDMEGRSELTATIDACNKSNVAVYPIDVRGLVAPLPGGMSWRFGDPKVDPAFVKAGYFQAKGGGGGAPSHGGGTSSPVSAPGKSGGTTTTGTTNTNPVRSPFNTNTTNPLNQPRVILPHLPDVTTQQDVLYALASGTGGFVIVNTNDLVGGLDRIANELKEYYVLGYSPVDDAQDGSCHELKVKLDKSGVNIRSRTGYCSMKPVDLLAGTSKGKELESRAAGSEAGTITATMQSAYFFTAPNTARVDVAMQMPADAVKFKKEKGKMRAEINLLGVAYTPDGGIGGKFSDTLKLEFENKKEVEEFQSKPLDYEAQFDLASGKYTLKVVFSAAGEGFGKLDTPLVVDAYDSKKFSLSSVAMSTQMHKVNAVDANLDATLLADKTPLIVGGLELTPDASHVFKKDTSGAFYLEIYEPGMLEAKPRTVSLQMQVYDKATNEKKLDSGLLNMATYARPGNPVIPVGLRIPAKELAAGSYRVDFKAADDAGNVSAVRSADFEVRQ